MNSRTALGGRPMHEIWEQQKFTRMKAPDGKYVAYCQVCTTKLKNTSCKRLQSHRSVCTLQTNSGPNQQKSPSQVPSASLTQTKLTLFSKTSNKQDARRSGLPTNISQSNNFDSSSDDDVPLSKHIKLTSPSASKETQSPILFDEIISTAAAEFIDLLEIDIENSNSTTNNNVSNTPQLPLEIVDSVEANSELGSFEHFNNVSEPTPAGQPLPLVSQNRRNNSQQFFVNEMSRTENGEINKEVAKFFFGCNIPFTVIESDWFKSFCKRLRPSYRVPTRKTLSTSLLDDAYNFCESFSKTDFTEDSCLLIDGWKNTTNNTKNVAVMVHNVNGNIIFLDSFDLTEESETGAKLADIVEECINLAKARYNTNIYAICSDNAANMLKMGRLCNLWHTTCNSHTANLLAKELVSEVIASKVTSILKAFHSPELERLLVKGGGSRIRLPADTRWCSYRDSFNCLLKNISSMKKIAAHEDEKISQKVHGAITRLIFDVEFIKQVQDSVKLFDPVCQLINICQQKTASVADAAEEWLTLQLPSQYLPNSEQQQYVNKRKKYALNKYALCANFLHPKYLGQHLNEAQLDEVDQFFLDTLDAAGLEQLELFRNRKDVFGTLINVKHLELPTAFWGFAEKRHPQLSELAMHLLNIPASSAQLERVFSNWSFVHSNLRNRLTVERSKKLVFVYHTLKMFDSNKSQDY